MSVAAPGPHIVSEQAGRGQDSRAALSVAREWAVRAAENVFSVLVPSDCRLCGEPLSNISTLPVCLNCLAAVRPMRGKRCFVCGERVLWSEVVAGRDGRPRCRVCAWVKRPFERAVAYGSYEEELRELVHLLKYNGVRPVARVLGELLAETLAALEPWFEQEYVLVVPVPLYKTKRWQRRFNQAELIARRAAKFFPHRLRLASDMLLRIRETESQIGMTTHQRRENMRGAFAMARAAEVTGREVLLVDDVYTTGATASECARVLRAAGAELVWVATVARTMKASGLKELGFKEPGFKVSTFQGFKDETEDEPA